MLTQTQAILWLRGTAVSDLISRGVSGSRSHIFRTSNVLLHITNKTQADKGSIRIRQFERCLLPLLSDTPPRPHAETT
jgi:hypothetical protein